MALPSRDERKSIQDEIGDINGIMAQIEVLLDDIKQCVDAISQRPFSEVEEIQNKLELVKRQNRHLIRTIKRLRNEQHELQRQLVCCTQEAENAVEAYQEMRRKLRNARRVIRDIVDEAGSLNRLSISQDEIDDALGDEDQDEFYDASESLSSDNDETFQQHTETDAPQSLVEPVPQDNPGMGDAAANNETTGYAETSLPGADDSIEMDTVEVDDFDDDHTESYLFEQLDIVDPPVYEMQDKVPPAVSQGMVFGPFSRRNLQAHLGLADAVATDLRSMRRTTEPGLCLRFELVSQFTHHAAFLYDPMFVECRQAQQTSFLVDWGTPEGNFTYQTMIESHGKSPIFHTFTFPQSQGKWYSIGALRWTMRPESEKPMWTTLTGASKRKIIRRICERSKGQISPKAAEERLEAGLLEEICVALTLAPEAGLSQRFATSYDLSTHSSTVTSPSSMGSARVARSSERSPRTA